MPFHSKITGNSAIHPAFYKGSSDPASPDSTVTAADKTWVDTTTGTNLADGWVWKIRNAGNTAWNTLLDLATALGLKANLASPTFTGTPAAPTAAFQTNTTQLATTAHVYAAKYSNNDAGNSSTAITINWATATTQKVTLTGNCTFTFSNPVAGGVYVLRAHQDATGTRTVTWPAAVHWSGGTAPTLTTTASKVDVFTFHYDGATYFGVTSGLNYTA